MKIHQFILMVIIFTNMIVGSPQPVDDGQTKNLANGIANGLIAIKECGNILKIAIQTELGEYFLKTVELDALFKEANNWQIRGNRVKNNDVKSDCAVKLTNQIIQLIDHKTIERFLEILANLLEKHQNLLPITDKKLKTKLDKKFKPLWTKLLPKVHSLCQKNIKLPNGIKKCNGPENVEKPMENKSTGSMGFKELLGGTKTNTTGQLLIAKKKVEMDGAEISGTVMAVGERPSSQESGTKFSEDINHSPKKSFLLHSNSMNNGGSIQESEIPNKVGLQILMPKEISQQSQIEKENNSNFGVEYLKRKRESKISMQKNGIIVPQSSKENFLPTEVSLEGNHPKDEIHLDENNLKGNELEMRHLERKTDGIPFGGHLTETDFSGIENPLGKMHLKIPIEMTKLEEKSHLKEKAFEEIQIKGNPFEVKGLNAKLLKAISLKGTHSPHSLAENGGNNNQIPKKLNVESPRRHFNGFIDHEIDKIGEIRSNNLQENEHRGESADKKIDQSKHMKTDSILEKPISLKGVDEFKSTDIKENANLSEVDTEIVEETSKKLKENVHIHGTSRIPSLIENQNAEEIDSLKDSSEKHKKTEIMDEIKILEPETAIEKTDKLRIERHFQNNAEIESMKNIDSKIKINNDNQTEMGTESKGIHKIGDIIKNENGPSAEINSMVKDGKNIQRAIESTKAVKIKVDADLKGNEKRIFEAGNGLLEEAKTNKTQNMNKQMTTEISKNKPPNHDSKMQSEPITTFYVFSGENELKNIKMEFLPKKKITQDEGFLEKHLDDNSQGRKWGKCIGEKNVEEENKFIVNWSECDMTEKFWESVKYPFVPVLQMVISAWKYNAFLKRDQRHKVEVDFSVEMTNFANLNGNKLKEKLQQLLKGRNEVEVNIENPDNPQLKFIDSDEQNNLEVKKSLISSMK